MCSYIPSSPPLQCGPDCENPVRTREWRDGSLESDLPMQELREMFNVNHFIVSQANPHIGPLLRLKDSARVCFGQWGAKVSFVLSVVMSAP